MIVFLCCPLPVFLFLLPHCACVVQFTGKPDLLPSLLCGDFNSTPNSPFLDFISSSRLDYSKLSAVTIAGYFEESSKSRPIPIPLLPDHLNIGPNCTYIKSQSEDTNGSKTTSSVTSNGPGEDTEGSVMRLSAQVERVLKTMTDESTGQDLKSEPQSKVNGSDVLVAQQNEEFKKESLPVRPSYRTRSARGARARGTAHSGTSTSTSLLGATDLKPSHLAQPPSPRMMDWQAEGTNDDDVKMDEDKTQQDTSQSLGRKTNQGKESKNHKLPPSPGVLAHPFKFKSAYPHLPDSVSSTVTTYHQSAFETVDYIFTPQWLE